MCCIPNVLHFLTLLPSHTVESFVETIVEPSWTSWVTMASVWDSHWRFRTSSSTWPVWGELRKGIRESERESEGVRSTKKTSQDNGEAKVIVDFSIQSYTSPHNSSKLQTLSSKQSHGSTAPKKIKNQMVRSVGFSQTLIPFKWAECGWKDLMSLAEDILLLTDKRVSESIIWIMCLLKVH